MRSLSFLTIIGLSFFLLTSCGKNATGVATVTLATGLENSYSHSLNFMEAFTVHALDFSVNAASCRQSQILAAFGPKNEDSDANALSSFAVNLVTPTTAGNSVNSYSGGVAGWLLASTLQKISIPAPTNVLLDFGILGSLSAGETANLDGTCATESGGSLYPTYSLAGHTSALISGDTTLPIRMWGIAAAASAADIPAVPEAGSHCASMNNNSQYAQECPNLNFKQVKVSCPTGSACYSVNNYTLQLEYFFSVNGSPHITQRVNLTSATGASAEKLLIPDIDPMILSVLDNANTVIEKIQVSDQKNSTPTPTPYFILPSGTADNSFVTIISGSGVIPSPTP